MTFFFSSRRRHTRFKCDWSSDVCSSELVAGDRAQGHQGQKRSDGKVAGAGKNACGYKEGITGKEEADEKTCFNKNNEANQKGAAPPNQSFNVIERMQQVAYEFEHAANSPLKVRWRPASIRPELIR